MIRAVRTTLFNDKANATRKHLETIVDGDDVSKIGAVNEIRSSDKLDVKYVVSEDGNILTLSKNYLSINYFNKLLQLSASDDKESKDNHLDEKQDYYIDFTPYENQVYKALSNVRNFLKRALGRTTGMFSRILQWTLGKVGYQFKAENPEATFTAIEKDTFNDSTFIRDFSRYFFKSRDISSSSSQNIPEPDFQQSQIKNNFAKFALKIMNFFSKLPDVVVNYFPLAFCFQNVTMPWLAKACPEGGLGRFFNFMRMVNPWLDEFASSVMGIFKQEILETKDTLKGINDDLVSGGNKTEKFSEGKANNAVETEEVNLIKLSPLSKEQYSLKHTIDDLNSALTRLIGKKNNISSLIIFGILRFYRFTGYPDFASKTLKRPDFIQKLHECLVEAKASSQGNNSTSMTLINAKIDEKFKDSNMDRQAAKAAVALITLSHGIKEDYVTNYPRFFGKIYSWQYLFMPIITRLVGNKGFIGKTLNFIADINPLLNDFCFDPLATFQEEILGMKDKSKSIQDLLPKIPELKLSSTLTSIANSGRALIDAVYSFGRGLYEKATASQELQAESAKVEVKG